MRILPQILAKDTVDYEYLKKMSNGSILTNENIFRLVAGTIWVMTKGKSVYFNVALLKFSSDYLETLLCMVERKSNYAGSYEIVDERYSYFVQDLYNESFSVSIYDELFCEIKKFQLIQGAIDCAMNIRKQVEYLLPDLIDIPIYQLNKLRETYLIDKLRVNLQN